MLTFNRVRQFLYVKLNIPITAEKFTKEFRGISRDTIIRFNAFTDENEDNFKDRIVFPITNIYDEIIFFCGRYIYSHLDPKYKIVPSGVKPILFPQKINPINNSMILVEGLFDMLNLQDNGLTNAVCSFGTAFGSVRKYQKKKENLEKLNIYKFQGVTKIYIMYDGDAPGRKAAEHLEAYIGDKFITEIIYLSQGKDPGSLTKQEIEIFKNDYYSNN